MTYLRKSTAGQIIHLGPFLSSTDGNTEMTALSIANTDIRLQKAGASSKVAKNSGGATSIEGGTYDCTLDATDTDTVGRLLITCHPSGAVAYKDIYEVLPADRYDAMFSESTTAPPTLAQIEASTVLAKEATVEVAIGLVGGYSLSSPTYDAYGNMTAATITSGAKTYTVTATYNTDGTLATYIIEEA